MTGEWVKDRACRDLDAEKTVFGHGTAQRATARRYCASCPVREVCLWTAMVAEGARDHDIDEHPARWFLFGGLTGPQRTELATIVPLPEARAELRAALERWDSQRGVRA